MDAQAVLAATKEDLVQLGLTEKGHILCIKAFAMRQDKTVLDKTKKESLVNAIKRSTSDRTVVKETSNNEFKIQIGWKHSNEQCNLAQVRKQCGGGVREVVFLNSDPLSKVMEEAIKLFFPNKNAKKCGFINNVTCNLGDFCGEIISDLHQSVETYVNTVKMSGKTRLHLLTERRNLFKELLKRYPYRR